MSVCTTPTWRSMERTGLDQVFPTFHDFMLACQEVHYTGNKLMGEACRINADIAGIGIHSLNDGDWIVGAGLIDNFRNPKRAYYAIQEVFADRYIAIRPSRQNVYAGQGVQIMLTSVNDEEAVAGTLSLQVTASDGQRLLDLTEETSLPAGIVDLGEYGVATDGLAGRCLVEAVFRVGDAVVVENNSSFYVLERESSALPRRDAALIDLDGALGAYLAGSDLSTTPFSAETSRSWRVLVNLNGWGGEEQPIFADLERWVSAGGDGRLPRGAAGGRFEDQVSHAEITVKGYSAAVRDNLFQRQGSVDTVQPRCPRASGLRRSAIELPDGAGVPRCCFTVVDCGAGNGLDQRECHL